MTDYNLDAEKEAKEKMMEEMVDDACSGGVVIGVNALLEICDRLIRKGWRKVKLRKHFLRK